MYYKNKCSFRLTNSYCYRPYNQPENYLIIRRIAVCYPNIGAVHKGRLLTK